MNYEKFDPAIVLVTAYALGINDGTVRMQFGQRKLTEEEAKDASPRLLSLMALTNNLGARTAFEITNYTHKTLERELKKIEDFVKRAEV